MPDARDPVVIGHYPTSGEANLACNRLRAEGIPAEVADDVTADMDWGLNFAIGMVKVLVPGECAEQARAIIDDKVSDAALDYAARQTCVDPEPDDPPELPPNDREKNAERAYRGAFLGILFIPFQFYVFWILIKVYVANEAMRPRYRVYSWVALCVVMPFILFQLLIGHLLVAGLVEMVRSS